MWAPDLLPSLILTLGKLLTLLCFHFLMSKWGRCAKWPLKSFLVFTFSDARGRAGQLCLSLSVFLHAFNRYLLSTNFGPGTVLAARGGKGNEALKVLPSVSYGLMWKQVNKQDTLGGGQAPWGNEQGRESSVGRGGAGPCSTLGGPGQLLWAGDILTTTLLWVIIYVQHEQIFSTQTDEF